MFGDLFGNVQKQQEELQKKLAEIMVEAEAGDGAVTVQASGDMHIENIKIDATKADVTDLEQLEDLILVAVNRALDKAKEKASEESAKLMQNMLPTGMGDLDQFMKGLK
jgi:DNA-binding YbaB/EbfC family protein